MQSCRGYGIIKILVHFLQDVCEQCGRVAQTNASRNPEYRRFPRRVRRGEV